MVEQRQIHWHGWRYNSTRGTPVSTSTFFFFFPVWKRKYLQRKRAIVVSGYFEEGDRCLGKVIWRHRRGAD